MKHYGMHCKYCSAPFTIWSEAEHGRYGPNFIESAEYQRDGHRLEEVEENVVADKSKWCQCGKIENKSRRFAVV